MTLALTYTVWYSFSVFYVALLEEFGWSRASSAGVFSLFVVMVGVFGAGAGVLADRFGPGRIVSLGSLALAGGLLACSQIKDLPQFYLYYGVLSAFGLSLGGWIPCVTLVNRWFSRKLGAALGVTSAGIGAGILVMVPLTQWWIGQLGWRTTYNILAVCVLVGILPVALLLFTRSRPEDLGMHRDGQKPLAEGALPSGTPVMPPRTRIVDAEWVARPWTVGSAIRTPRFWLLVAMMYLSSVATQTVFVHQVAFLVDGGYDKMLAASIVGLIGILSVGAKISWGWLSDRLGRELTWSAGLCCTLVGVSALIATRYVGAAALIYVFALAFAIGYGATAPLAPAIGSDVFAGRTFGAIYGTLSIANGLGSATGAWFAGYLFDVTGSYVTAFGLAGACGMMSILAVWMAAPRKVRRVPGRG